MASLPETKSADPTCVAAPATSLTVSDVCANYVAFLEGENAVSSTEVKSTFKRFVYSSELGKVPAKDATKEQFLVLLRAAKQQSSSSTQRKLGSYLKSAFNRLVGADNDMAVDAPPVDSQIEVNPLASITSSKKTGVREHPIKTNDLRALWKRMQLPARDSGTVKLRAARLALLLGGQRGVQLLRVPRELLDLEAGTILLKDPKGKDRRTSPRQHWLPVAGQAKRELQWLDSYSAELGSPFVFPATDPSERLGEKEIGMIIKAISDEMLAAGECLTPIQFADFRSTVETTLAELGVPSDVMQHLQSHGLSGVQKKNYMFYKYMAEMRKALALWERYLQSLLDGSDPGRWGSDIADTTPRKQTSKPPLANGSGRDQA
jgi:hypothetical protein